MSLINICNLTFSYDTSRDSIFESVSFQIDTKWKLGFIGRNGRGKTTFLKLLMGEYPYGGSITASVKFTYFPCDAAIFETATALQAAKEMIAPYAQWEREMERCLAQPTQDALVRYGALLENYLAQGGYTIEEEIKIELSKLGVSEQVLTQSYSLLSNGEKVKLQLAALFLRKNHFLLIDEPTNHLDANGRETVANYLSGKTGFILVSHDRCFLDQVIDHVLSINRSDIIVQKGNFSSWQKNMELQEQYEQERENRLKKDISRMKDAARRTAAWSNKTEQEKKGAPDKGYVGHKAAKLMKRSIAIVTRQEKAIEEKSALFKNMETAEPLKLHLLEPPKKMLVEAENLFLSYQGREVFQGVSFSVSAGERIALSGKNGSGKSSIIRAILGESIPVKGNLRISNGLSVGYVSQDTSFLQGDLRDFALREKIDEPLFKAILRKLDFSRVQFEKDMIEFSDGQKKKVLLAASLSKPVHLLLWDEPLNFIDILSRMQIEELLLKEQPAMVFVEHDCAFREKIATKTVIL